MFGRALEILEIFVAEFHGVARSQCQGFNVEGAHTQEPDDHDHSDHNGTPVQLQEFVVVKFSVCLKKNCPTPTKNKNCMQEGNANLRHVTKWSQRGLCAVHVAGHPNSLPLGII